MRILWVLFTALLSSVGAAAAVDITTCGTTVAAGDTGVLQADLDCPTSLFAVRLLRRATLDLNGHAVRGSDSTGAVVMGVSRENPVDTDNPGRGDFTIVGPGEISGTTHPPLPTGTRSCILLNAGHARITSASGIVDIHHCNVGILGSAFMVPDQGRLLVDHVAIHDAVQGGVTARTITAAQVSADDNGGIGIGAAGRLRLTDAEAHGNQIGFFAGRSMTGSDVTATDNSLNGVDSCGFGSVKLSNLVATGNAFAGACADRLRLEDSTVTGNTTFDVYSIRLPVLINTTCGTSAGVNSSSTSWGVCAND
jgi:hypothetical protein